MIFDTKMIFKVTNSWFPLTKMAVRGKWEGTFKSLEGKWLQLSDMSSISGKIKTWWDKIEVVVLIEQFYHSEQVSLSGWNEGHNAVTKTDMN